MGIPVVIASNGRGICVRNVTSGAPVMTVATNGFGIPIVLGTTGIPFVVQGGGTPTPTPTPAPSFSVQPSVTGTPQVGVSFVGTPGTASNTTGHTYRWLLSTTSGGTYTAISGATSASYTPVSGDETKYLKFEDTATGPGGSTVATTTFAGPVAAVGITAPVITQTSTAGTGPFLWTTAENATFFEGFYWNVQTATGASTSAASTALSAGTTTADIIQQIDAADLSGTDPITFTGLTTTSSAGAIALRERVGSEDGLGGYNWGPWSNILTDTIPAVVTPVQLVTTSGAHKSSYGTVSGTPALTYTMSTNITAQSWVAADTVVTGKRHFELTVNSFSNSSNNIAIGCTDNSVVLGPSAFNNPGSSGVAGFRLLVQHGGTTADLFYNGAYQSSPALIGAAAVSDKFVCEFDTATNIVSVWHYRSGTSLLLGTFTLTSGIPTNWVAVCAGVDTPGTPDSMTMNFAGPFAKTASSGYVPYG